MQPGIRELLEKRRNRTIAIILGYKEREIDPALKRDGSNEASQKLRKVVLDQINEFYELVIDIIESLDTGEVALNENYLRMIDELHEAVVGTWVGSRR